MPMLTISGAAWVLSEPSGTEPVTEPQVLSLLHGLSSPEEVGKGLLDTPPLSELGLRGGRLRFVFTPEDGSFRISTSYLAGKKLSDEDTALLTDITLSQWSDGLGSGAFLNHVGEVLSTSLAQAIRNVHGDDSGHLGEYFVDAFPFVDDRQLRVEWSDQGDLDEFLAQDLEWACEQGYPSAHFTMAQHLQEGIGRAQDLSEALKFYRKAAEAGHAFAMGMVGHFLEGGLGTDSDLQEAARWYQRGAEAGNIVCRAQLAECFEMGRGVGRDLARARQLYQECFDAGFSDVSEALERLKAG